MSPKKSLDIGQLCVLRDEGRSDLQDTYRLSPQEDIKTTQGTKISEKGLDGDRKNSVRKDDQLQRAGQKSWTPEKLPGLSPTPAAQIRIL